MKRQMRDQWVAALRSGEYEQGRQCLRSGKGQYCCLGVLAHINGKLSDKPEAGKEYEGSGILFDDRYYGLSTPQQCDLWSRNDGSGFPVHTFAELADYIEQNIPVED